MQQHPIPQNVTQYQFRLVGDMTLKQFLELCLGLLFAYVFFASNLIFFIKWPLIILSVLFGVGLAFFPIEDRPLDQWIINFLKSIYAPTRFIWKKTNKVPSLFTFTSKPPEVVNTITKTIKAPPPSGGSGSTIKSLDLSELETTRLSSLNSLFSAIPPSQTTPLPARPRLIEKPSIQVRKLKPAAMVAEIPIKPPPAVASTPAPQASVPVSQATASPPTEKVVFTAPSATTTTKFSPSLASPKKITLPASPRLPNLVSGVVVNQDGKLVENAIVQIVENGGLPARAMKTNSLGQFYTSTPLSPGSYLIEVDKDGLSFPPQQITINDAIFSPIELRANS